MKSVIMINETGKTSFFDTVEEAKQDAIVLSGETFAIYTLYMTGQLEVSWKLQTDTGTNLREVKKQQTSPRAGTEWTTLEEKALMDALELGKQSMSQIAKTLGRSYSACYRKMQQIKERNAVEKSGTG